MSLKNKRVLITCGPTWVSIDDIRVITNRSTGALGQQIAKDLRKRGTSITLLEGPVQKPYVSKSIKRIKYFFYQELFDLLKKELSKKKYDIIIHAAAVSDYSVKNKVRTKIRSGVKQLKLVLVPTIKIINEVKKLSPKSFLVGFKLESSSNKKVLTAKAVNLIGQARCDLVVANSIKNGYQGYIVNKEGRILSSARSKNKLSKNLITILNKEI